MKKHLLRLAFINGLLFLSICIFAQEYSDFYFTRVNGENGLSESNVKAILQDSYGFMWFGTKNGLNRYDGTSILQFDCDDLEEGTGNHNIGALFEDKERNLWVGTDRGVYIGEFYQFNLSSCIRHQNSLTAQFVSFSLSNLANIFYPPPNFYNN